MKGFLSRGGPVYDWNDAQIDYFIQALGVIDRDNSKTRLPYEKVAGHEDVLEVQVEPLVAHDCLNCASDIVYHNTHQGTSSRSNLLSGSRI